MTEPAWIESTGVFQQLINQLKDRVGSWRQKFSFVPEDTFDEKAAIPFAKQECDEWTAKWMSEMSALRNHPQFESFIAIHMCPVRCASKIHKSFERPVAAAKDRFEFKEGVNQRGRRRFTREFYKSPGHRNRPAPQHRSTRSSRSRSPGSRRRASSRSRERYDWTADYPDAAPLFDFVAQAPTLDLKVWVILPRGCNAQP